MFESLITAHAQSVITTIGSIISVNLISVHALQDTDGIAAIYVANELKEAAVRTDSGILTWTAVVRSVKSVDPVLFTILDGINVLPLKGLVNAQEVNIGLINKDAVLMTR